MEDGEGKKKGKNSHISHRIIDNFPLYQNEYLRLKLVLTLPT